MADVSVDEQRRHLVRWLRRNDAEATTLHETHVSILAFTGDRVFKCKKAVRFPFVDLSTLDRRRSICDREVALNRRLSPDVYLGVVPIVDDAGAIVDFVVEMRRLADDRRLSAVIEHEACAGTKCIDDVVDRLLAFHANARAGDDIDSVATPSALEASWRRNFEELRRFAPAVLDPLMLDRVEDDAGRYLAGRAVLFAMRVAGRRIRDGHGDLLADDVFCLADGPRILDCLEFDDDLRFGDVLADVAFLAMDLERLGRGDLARRLLDRYRSGSGDGWPASLEHFYIAYRALVRAKVACLRVADDAGSRSDAHRLLELAASHLADGRVRLVLVGGPPATGKTSLARALGHLTGWVVFSSDEVRKQLAGLDPTTSAGAPLDRGLYTARWSDRTYSALLDRARAQLERGCSVILDASWGAGERRSDALRLAAMTASDLSSFVCDVAPQVADARASARVREGNDASDATPGVAAELRARFAVWPGAVPLDTTASPETVAQLVVMSLGLKAHAE